MINSHSYFKRGPSQWALYGAALCKLAAIHKFSFANCSGCLVTLPYLAIYFPFNQKILRHRKCECLGGNRSMSKTELWAFSSSFF